MSDILLFDVDNTLLRNSRSHRQAFHAGFSRVFGVQGDVESINPHGMTDLQILWEVLTRSGVPEKEISAKLQECVGVIERTFSELIRTERLKVLDGVRELLEKLSSRAFPLGLVTGNLESIAWDKLERTGLRRFFRFGGFGSDERERSKLVGIAVTRARSLGYSSEGGHTVLIGDTPRDVAAGRAAGALTIAVATGVYSEEELTRSGADGVLASFRPPAAFVTLLEKLGT